MPLRIWVAGTSISSAPAGNSSVAGDGTPLRPPAAGADGLGAAAAAAATGAGDVPLPADDGAADRVPVRIASTTLRTSSRVIRPPPPVPSICAAVRSCSRRRRRTAGVIRASGSPAPIGAVVLVAVGALADVAAAVSLHDRSSLPAGPVATAGGWVGAAADSRGAAAVDVGSGVFDAADVDSVAGAVAALAASPAPSSAVSITAISALFGTVAPSSTRISRSVPSNGDGTSALTLSVTTSTRGSYLATWSPGCFSHFPIVPSATLSPSWGIVTLATIAGPPLAVGAGPARWVDSVGG